MVADDPSPCESCSYAQRCTDEHLACPVFVRYVEYGVARVEGRRYPKRELYVQHLTRAGIEEMEKKGRNGGRPRKNHSTTNIKNES